jgi:hypothetical protein
MIQYPIYLFSNRDFRDIKQPTEKLEIQMSLKSLGKGISSFGTAHSWGIIRPLVSGFILLLFIWESYYWNLQFLNNGIKVKRDLIHDVEGCFDWEHHIRVVVF